MPDTVGLEQHKPTSLRGIAEKAKADKQHRFRDLYRELNAGFLLTCWRDLNKNAASGVDKVTAEEYAKNLHGNIQNLAERLKGKKYRTKLVRRCWIPKENGKERPLGIPAREDGRGGCDAAAPAFGHPSRATVQAIRGATRTDDSATPQRVVERLG